VVKLLGVKIRPLPFSIVGAADLKSVVAVRLLSSFSQLGEYLSIDLH
jgi:hypothetical protein